jgi:hypothetical protein
LPPSSRREFLRTTGVTIVALAAYSPAGAWAQATDAEASTANAVLRAAALASFNKLPDRHWSDDAARKMRGQLGYIRPWLAALEREAPGLSSDGPPDASRRIVRLLLPGYQGPKMQSPDEWQADADAGARAIKRSGSSGPKPGTFDFPTQPTQADRDRLLTDTPPDELRASQAAASALAAATLLAHAISGVDRPVSPEI